MKQQALLDTGSLVAFINRRDRYYEWAKAEWAQISPPLLTCEAVITEACFLLQPLHGGMEAVLSLVRTEVVQIPFSLIDEVTAVETLLSRYRSVPMSFADACLVRMAERYPDSSVFTLDSDFQIYRKNINQAIPLIFPAP